ncbi:MAG: hypothetical protein IJY82_01140 [Oscillospiraceae bacterium]|nr:hypothetical protein [Oscillospiraceae bacterium]
MRQRLLCLLTVAALLVTLLGGCSSRWQRALTDGSSASPSAEAIPPAPIKPSEMPEIEGYRAAAGNDTFYLYYHPETLDVILEDRRSGQRWNMVPEGWEEDSYAVGPARMYLGSGIVLDVYNSEKNQLASVASLSDSVRKSGTKVTLTSNGFDVQYTFKSSGIQLTVKYQLTETGFRLSIPQDSIKEGDKGELISKISVMPYFGAAKLDDSGYLLIPDGSGALVEFSGNPSSLREQAQVIYGFDNSIALSAMPNRTQPYALPVFGIKKGEGAMLGIIRDGEAMARINAGVAGSGSSNYRINTVFTYRDVHTLILYEGQSTERYVNDISTEPNRSNFDIDYRFLTGQEVGYSEMAACYREYLLDNDLLNQAKTQFSMDLSLIGAIRETEQIAGVPVALTKSLTSFEDAQMILKKLREAGVDNIQLTYYGAQSGGWMNEKIGSFEPDSVLGGAGGFESLMNYIGEDSGIALTVSADLINVYRTGHGFTANYDAVRQLTDAYSKQKIWNVVDGSQNRGLKAYYLLEPSKLVSFTKRFLESVPQGVSLAVNDIGVKIYSQFAKNNFTTREEALDEWNKALALLKANNQEVKVNGANSYVLPYATFLSGMPESSGGTDMETQSVPFYQMVVHGYIPYSLTPGNLRSDSRDEFLRMVEYGACPAWIFGADDSSRLKETRYNEYFSAGYEDWLEESVEEYLLLKELYEGLSQQKMVSHQELSDDAYVTEYEDGTKIYVNYGDQVFQTEGVSVAAKDYLVVKGASK